MMSMDQKRDALSRLAGQAQEAASLEARDYGLQFRGGQYDLKNMAINNPRDSEDPATVLKRIEDEFKTLANDIRNALSS